jgi:XTP/dITP diphosphohydrolase
MLSSLVIATHNKGKLREIQELLAPHRLHITSAGELGLPEPPETGMTFIENAEIKSKAAALASGTPSLSDDSGLCIEALGGAPGVYSADWAGPGKNFSIAIERVEKELKARGAIAPFAAYFICVLSLCYPDGTTVNFEGRVDGTLVFPPRGAQGFGYDPIFIPNGYTQTFGEMIPSEKHAMSHRAKAFVLFENYIHSLQVKHG